ncbi:MAG TPA: CBS domain-containing protein [Thermosulfidibacter takaii]|uniref:CBS domain-containing protein n=1 Tax=Thermosulfidibacter takaii TaxID=412593 RepID=A0A7C0Y5K7_9BACT|nr:CBS domain-containing protein [Thermosulfidibacter takaii]
MATTVKRLLDLKGRNVWWVTPETVVYDALKLMADKDIGAVLVLKDGKLVGIFSERDYARKVILKGKSSKETTVGELMSKKVFYVSPDQTLEECMALMTEEHIRHLPVLENGELVGIVTIGDVVHGIIKDQKFTIEELQRYIIGG